MNGLLAILASGITGGAFPLPEKSIKGWKWEHVWAIYSLVAMLILPIATAIFFAPDLLSKILAGEPVLSLKIVGSGLLFGLGSVLFGLSLVRLGMAITNALVSGIIVFLGSIGPVLIGTVQLDAKRMLYLILGLVLLVASLGLCAGAAVSRDKAQHKRSETRPLSLVSLTIAALAGCLSAMLNIGFSVGAPLAEKATAAGLNPMLSTLAIWIPALFGGALINVGYPLLVVSQRRSWRVFSEGTDSSKAWLLASLMGLLWYANIMLYGYGASAMSAGAVYGWALSSAASILTSNALGAFAGEWRGAGTAAKVMMALSTLFLIGSFLLLASQSLGG